MDKSDLLKIAVTAVATIVARELVGFILKYSKTTANIVKPIAIAIFKRHWMIIPVLLDGFFVTCSIYILSKSVNDETLATRKFVFFCGLNFVNFCFFFQHFGKDLINYLLELKRTRPAK